MFQLTLSLNYRAFIAREDQDEPMKIQLEDKGAGPDQTANDGIYSRYFSQYDGFNGRYTFKCKVEGNNLTAVVTQKGGTKSVIENSLEKSYPLNASSPICCGSSTGNNVITESTGIFTRKKNGNSFKIKNAPASDFDIFPPSKVSTFKAKLEDYITVDFIAPGDDFDDGQATRYEIKFTEDVIHFTSLNLWNNLDESHVITQENIVYGSLDPVPGGTNVGLQIDRTLFQAQKVYYLAMVAYDDQDIASPISNFAQILIKPKCGMGGKCKGYPVLSFTFTGSQAACLNLCKHGSYEAQCHWITYDPDTRLCELFESCNLSDSGDCANCISSEVYCDAPTDPACYVKGLCEVCRFISVKQISTHLFLTCLF